MLGAYDLRVAHLSYHQFTVLFCFFVLLFPMSVPKGPTKSAQQLRADCLSRFIHLSSAFLLF